MHACIIMTECNLLESLAHKLHFLHKNLVSQTIDVYFYAYIYSFNKYLWRSCSAVCQTWSWALGYSGNRRAVSPALRSRGLVGVWE